MRTGKRLSANDPGLGFWISDLGWFWVLEFRFWSLDFGVGLRVSDFGCGISDFGFGVIFSLQSAGPG